MVSFHRRRFNIYLFTTILRYRLSKYIVYLLTLNSL
uniref:Uncharacterized protein n=1 Tax=Podoviridae sp. ctZkC8 TaxID=2825259 RepID=A0A8S5UC08_9CAUD|nr:MAG TPA: hypothetical protein [Podoviridae sp. ctZkC8]